jgi:glutathione S-transferase
MLTLHHLEHSRSQRVLWLLEELGLRYEVKRYARDRKTLLAPPELARVHPLGKSPVVTDGDITVAESGAIVEYLLDTHDEGGTLRPPPGTAERRRFTYWLHFAEGSAMPPLLMKLVFHKVGTASPLLVRPLAKAIGAEVNRSFLDPNLRRQYDFMQQELAERGPWFAGRDFSAADIQMSFPVEAAAARGGLDDRWPAVMDWLQRIHARPAYHRALQAGGPYKILD